MLYGNHYVRVMDWSSKLFNLFVLFGYTFAAIFVVFLVLVFADGHYEFHNLLPVMGDGIRPVLSSVLPQY